MLLVFISRYSGTECASTIFMYSISPIGSTSNSGGTVSYKNTCLPNGVISQTPCATSYCSNGVTVGTPSNASACSLYCAPYNHTSALPLTPSAYIDINFCAPYTDFYRYVVPLDTCAVGDSYSQSFSAVNAGGTVKMIMNFYYNSNCQGAPFITNSIFAYNSTCPADGKEFGMIGSIVSTSTLPAPHPGTYAKR